MQKTVSAADIFERYGIDNNDLLPLAIFAAERVIDTYEMVYPDDSRPRRAIIAAKEFSKEPNEHNRVAAHEAATLAGEAAQSVETYSTGAWAQASAASAAASAQMAALTAEFLLESPERARGTSEEAVRNALHSVGLWAREITPLVKIPFWKTVVEKTLVGAALTVEINQYDAEILEDNKAQEKLAASIEGWITARVKS